MIKANIVAGLADLSEAAYVRFTAVGPDGLAGADLKAALMHPDDGNPVAWTESRSEAFTAEWRVVAHKPNTSSGFSATVFERIAPKTGESRYVFAARGTEEFLNDLLLADLADLVVNGLAWEQVIDLYNWWNELTTPLGGTYQRATAVRVSDALAGQPITIVEAGQLWRIDLTPTTQSATPRIPASSVVDVTGHSLGGHLATAFSRLFPANTASVVTINGAGYSVAGDATGNVNRFFAALSGQATFPASQILNIYGDRGPELVTQNSGLVQPGAHLQARIEDWNALTNMLGHGSSQMSQSLALYDLLRGMEETDAAAAMDAPTMLARYGDMLRSGSRNQYEDYESLLTDLRQLLLNDTQGTIVGDAESFYSRLIDLKNSSNYRELKGKVTVEVSGLGLKTRARNDFAAIVALQDLSSVTIVASSAAGSSALESLWQTTRPSAYTDWLADKTAKEPQTFTDPWIEDRAAMLDLLVAASKVDDEGAVLSNGVKAEQVFRDYKSSGVVGTELRTGSKTTADADRRHFLFGSDANDTLTGGNVSDRIYGGNGNDVLKGGKGSDYLEGNFGFDKLEGGEGNDHLQGGDGDDELFGDDGNDRLRGGAGGDKLNGGADADTLYGDTGADELRGDAGIDVLYGGAGADKLYGGADNDFLFDEGGIDANQLFGEAGNDQLEVKGGTGNFTLDGGLDNDVLRGSQQGSNLLIGGAGNDWLQGGDLDDVLLGDSLPNFGPDGADLIEAGKGNDQLTGGGGADLLRGGEGNDTYLFLESTGFGTDVIEDAQGSNALSFGGKQLGEASYDSDKQAWISAATGLEIRKFEAGGSTTLAISNPADANSTLYLRNWTPGQFGLTLSGEPDEPAKPAVSSVAGTALAGNNYVDVLRNDAGDGGLGNDFVVGSAAKSVLAGGSGNDVVDGRDGDDWLEGGEGDDIVLTGAGKDVAYGGSGNDLMRAGYYFDMVRAIRSDTGGLALFPGQDGWLYTDENTSAQFYYYADAAHTQRVDIAHPELAVFDFNVQRKQEVNPTYTGHMFWSNVGDPAVSLEPGLEITLTIGDSQKVSRGAFPSATPTNQLGAPLSLSVFLGNAKDMLVGGTGHQGVQMWGGTGDDVIYGANENDRLYGEADDDLLVGYDGDDQLYGGEGHDELSGGAGRDFLDGGDGADFLVGGYDADVLYGGAGDDSLVGDATFQSETKALPAGIDKGRFGGDLLDGGAGNDSLWGNGGDDYLYGGTENDVLYGGEGDDHSFGEAGNDTLWGNEGGDYLDGGAGTDTLYGGDGGDMLMGGAGDDSLEGEEGDDLLDGGADKDTLRGGGGSDNLRGGSGDDLLIGDAGGEKSGNDTLEGGTGNDSLQGGAEGDLYVFSLGDGNDTINDDGSDGSRNTIVFKFSRGEAHVSLKRDLEDLVISYGDNDSVRVVGYYSGNAFALAYGGGGASSAPGESESSIAQIIFEDGTVWNTQDILAMAPPPDPSSAPADPFAGMSELYFVNALLSRESVKAAGKHSLSYSFNTSFAPEVTGAALFTDEQKQAVRDALAKFSAVLNLSFTEVPDGGTVDLRFGLDDLVSAGMAGFAGYAEPSTGAIHLNSNRYSEVRVDQFGDSKTRESFSLGEPGFVTLLHEIGHALGLKHPFEAPVLPLAENTRANSVMSYTMVGAEPTELAAFDIAALQYLYGVASDRRAGDSTYSFADRFVDDAGGLDTFDASAETLGVSVNLAPGSWNYRGAKADSILADGQAFIGFGTVVENVIGGAGSDTLGGNSGNNLLEGGAGSDSLTGACGDDTLAGGGGADSYFFAIGDGSDIVIDGGQDSTVSIQGTTVDSLYYLGGRLYYGAYGDSIQVALSELSTLIVGGTSYTGAALQTLVNDKLTGNGDVVLAPDAVSGRLTGSGDWRLTGNALANSLIGNAGHNFVSGGMGNDTILGGDGNDTLLGNDDDDLLEGGGGRDSLEGGLGNDTLRGGAGDDMLSGAAGLDVLQGDDGNDLLQDGEVMYGGLGSDTYVLSTWPTSDVVISESADIAGDADILLLPATVKPSDVMLMHGFNSTTGGYDDLWLSVSGQGGAIVISKFLFAQSSSNQIEEVRFADGTRWTAAELIARRAGYQSSDGSDTISGNRWSENLNGLGGDDWIRGDLGDDAILGDTGNDTLYGDMSGGSSSVSDGNDTLDGGAGNDVLVGGGGNDTYMFGRDVGSDVVTEYGGDADRVRLSSGVSPADVQLFGDGRDLWIVIDNSASQLRVTDHFTNPQSAIEVVEFADGTVWDAAAILQRTVRGLPDTMTGTAGDDVFTVDHVGDVVVEGVAQGMDSIHSTVSYFLPANVESLTLTGPLNIDGTGNASNNLLTGNAGNNRLDGRGGADTLIGGIGDDIYEVDNEESTLRPHVGGSDDQVIEGANGGYDTVYAKSYDYKLPANVERLISVVDTSWFNADRTPIQMKLEGNELDNFIDHQPRGLTQTGAWIDGGLGADTMVGDEGVADTFVVDNVGDVVVDWSAGDGDTVNSYIDYQLGANIENLKLIGSAATTGRGNDGGNLLDGSGNSSANVLIGGKGDDVYVVGAGDVIVELAGEGTDTVILGGSAGGSFDLAAYQNVEIASLGEGVGTSSLIGTAAPNTLIGNAYANTLRGNDGDDTLVDGPGVAKWQVSDTDALYGGAGNDVLISRLGNDTLDGGSGDDTLITAQDVTVLFDRGSGHDSWTSSATGNAPTLVLGSDLDLAGMVVSRAGRDLTLSFGGGDGITIKQYFADEWTTQLQYAAPQVRLADQTVLSSGMLLSRLQSGNQNVATAGADLFLGSALGDALAPGDGDDWVYGGGGADTVEGGAGMDRLFGGADNDSLSGGAGDDLVNGGNGDDSLAGGAGADTLSGEGGSDTYEFAAGDGRDTVVDAAGSGDRIVFAAGITPSMVTATRADNARDLLLKMSGGADEVRVVDFFAEAADSIDSVQFSDGTLWDRATIEYAVSHLTGTAGNDMLLGGVGDDVLSGLAGADTLVGGGGNDTLTGGAGNDRLSLGLGNDVVTFGRGDGVDYIARDDRMLVSEDNVLKFSAGIAPADVTFKRVIDPDDGVTDVALELSITGTTDKVVIGGFYLRENPDNPFNPISRIEFSDGTVWTRAQFASLARTITGTAAANTLAGTTKSDRILGLDGDDKLTGSGGNDALEGGNGADTLDGGTGDDYLLGGAGADSLIGGAGSDEMVGGLGDDVYVADASDNIVEAPGEGRDTVQTSVDGLTLSANVEDLILTGTAGIGATGNANSNKLTGNSGDNSLYGDAGDDWLIGAGGNDYLSGDAGDDYLDGGDGADVLLGGTGNNIALGFAGADELSANAGTSLLDGGAGDDFFGYNSSTGGVSVIVGGTGSDWIDTRQSTGDQVILFNRGDGSDTVLVKADDGKRTVISVGGGIALGDISLMKDGLALVISLGGTDSLSLNAWFTGAKRSVVLQLIDAQGMVRTYDFTATAQEFSLAYAGNPSIGAWAAQSSLNAHLLSTNSQQAFAGGLAYRYAMGGSLESASRALLSSYLAVPDFGSMATDVAEPPLNGTDGDDSLVGGSTNNEMRGKAGNDTLDGGAGADTMWGGKGDDSYVVESVGDTVIEFAGEGWDSVSSSISYSLPSDVECLLLTGGGALNGSGNSQDNLLTGNSGANRLSGGVGNDTLNGGGGDDTLIGGMGDDTYVVDAAGDMVTEFANEGIDVVQSSVTMVLPENVETLVLTGTNAINGVGNSSNNLIIGNAGNNLLNGASGVDTLQGGAGNDTYLVDDVSDVVIEMAGEGADTVQASFSYVLGANIENLTLTGSSAIDATGNDLDNVLFGNAAANLLTGGLGKDTMQGGAGDDRYVVDVATDVIIENANEGVDSVESSVTYTLSANVENLTLTGSAAINGTGNAADNLLIGNSGANTLTGAAGNDTLDGGLGNDTMLGGAGNDTYVVNVATDVVTENASEGTDTVQSSVTWTLGANLENLILTGSSAVNGTGNALNNVISGNAAANALNGAAGADTMIGGGGDDIYVVDAVGDVVTEGLGEGLDLVQSSVTFTLSINVENLTLTGTGATNGTGNSLDNVLTGNGAANLLSGGAGNDTLIGGAGTDTLVGGAGNDSYVLDVAADVVTEVANEGIDTVSIGVTYTLGANLENLTLTGTSAINGTGNTLDNVLIGNGANNTLSGGAGNDTLDGGLGNDTMLGGAGNDTYVVNVATDVVTENANEGTDTVQSAVTYSLGSNLENLVLTGGAAVNGTGNALANFLSGNSASNTLTGAAGADTLDGGLGNDTLIGGADADSYVFGLGYGIDTIQENDATGGVLDKVVFGAGITAADIQFVQSGNDLSALLRNSLDKLVMKDWYLGTQYRVEEFRFLDGTVLTSVQAQALVGAMATFNVPAAAALGAGNGSRATTDASMLAASAMQ